LDGYLQDANVNMLVFTHIERYLQNFGIYNRFDDHLYFFVNNWPDTLKSTGLFLVHVFSVHRF